MKKKNLLLTALMGLLAASVSGQDKPFSVMDDIQGTGNRPVVIYKASGWVSGTENPYKLLIGEDKISGGGDKWCSNNSTDNWVIFSFLKNYYNIKKIVWRDGTYKEDGAKNCSSYQVFISATDTASGSWENVIDETVNIDESVRTHEFTIPVKARYVKFVPTATDNSGKTIRIYGFDMYGDKSDVIDRGDLVSTGANVLKYFDAWDQQNGRETAANLFDDNLDSHWATWKGANEEPYVIFDLKNSYELEKFKLFEGNTNPSDPQITGINIFVSNQTEDITNSDELLWTQIISPEDITFNATDAEKVVTLAETVHARYVKLTMPGGYHGGNGFIRLNEFEVYKKSGTSSISNEIQKDEITNNNFVPSCISRTETVHIQGTGILTVYSLQGKLVRNEIVSNSDISVSNIQNGAYLFSLKTKDGEVKRKKVLIK